MSHRWGIFIFSLSISCGQVWAQEPNFEREIAEYDRQIHQKQEVLKSKEDARSASDHEILKNQAALSETERRLNPLKSELGALKKRVEDSKRLLETAVTNPDLVDIAKIESLRKEYRAAQVRENEAQEDVTSFLKQVEIQQGRQNALRLHKQDIDREVVSLSQDILELMIRKPVVVEGVGVCVMHEEITVKACKEMALLRAKQNAIEAGGASLVSSLTQVNFLDLTKDEMRMETAVRVRHVEIIQLPTKYPEGELGKYLAKIRAVVQSTAQVQSYAESPPTSSGKDAIPANRQTQPPAKSYSGLSPTSAFNLAYNDYLNGRYDTSIERFQHFVKEFSGTSLLPNAYFWMGESYFSLKDYPHAIQAFQKVVNDHPRSEKVAPALFKMGIVTAEAGDLPKASAYFRRVIQDFSTSDEAKLAKNKLMGIK